MIIPVTKFMFGDVIVQSVENGKIESFIDCYSQKWRYQMNDRYLYRAKQIDNGEWVHGYLLNIAKINAFICTGKIKLDGTLKGIVAPEMYAVDPSTICQCTGLKDKNGKLIWENDIIRYEGMLFVVKWNDACAHFTAYKVRERTRCTPVINSGTMKITEVIGNIFDNMELLETGKEAGHQVNQNLLMPAT